MNKYNIKNKYYTYEYKESDYEISQLTPLLEIKRYFLIQDFYKEIETGLLSNNIIISINSVLPKWLMKCISLNIYKIDPIIPYNPIYFNSLIEDIKNVSKTKKSIKDITDIIINKIKIKELCNKYINKIRDFIKSDYYIDNRSKIKVNCTKIKNYIAFNIISPLNNKEINVNIINLKLNNNLYNKLKKKYILNIKENKTKFINLVFILILRYYMLESYNQQLACIPTFYEELKKKYNINFELFASAFNSYYNNYCCLFQDIEKYFGGICNFNNIKLIRGFYVANPPYDNSIMENMANNIINFLDNTNKSLGFILIIPAWDKNTNIYGEFKTLNILKNSKYFKYIYKIIKKNARFIDYINNRIITPTDIYIILLQNEEMIKTYNITEHSFIKLINDYWIKSNFVVQQGGNTFNYKKSIKNIDTCLTIKNSKVKNINIKIIIKKNPKKIYDIYQINKNVLENKFYSQASILYYPYNLLYDTINEENCITFEELKKKKYKILKIKNVNIPIYKNKKILVSNNCNIYNSFPSFELLYILIKYKIEFKGYTNIGIIDITPTYNDKEYELFIIKRNNNYIFAINQYFNTSKILKLNYYINNIINKNINNELKKNNTYDFIFISGGLEYFKLKKIKIFNEEILYYIFFYQMVILLKILKKGGHFIMYYKNTNTYLTHKLIYLLSMFFKNISLIKIKNDASIQHLVGINYLGIDKKMLSKFFNIIKKLKIIYPNFGENINIKNKGLRKKYNITYPLKKKSY